MMLSRGLLSRALLSAGDATAVTAQPVLVLDISVEYRKSTPALVLDIVVTQPYSPALVLDISVLPAPPVARIWRPVVVLDGVDVSALLTGEATVRRAESEASVATFVMRPQAGPLNLPAMTGLPVTMALAERDTDGSALRPVRRFTGVVDTPKYDVRTGRITLTCTDQLQEKMDAAPRAWVDAEVGGWFAEAVSGQVLDTYQYATARLASVSKAMDADVFGVLRVTPWAAKATPDLTLGAHEILDGSLDVQPAYRSDIRNQIEVTFDYQYPRLRGRGISAHYVIGSQVFIYDRGLDYLSRESVESALSSLGGWELRGKINYQAVKGGTYNLGTALNPKLVAIPTEDAPNICIGFSAKLTTRWVQTGVERYTLIVRNTASQAAIGLAREQRSYSMSSDFDTAEWEANPAQAPVLTIPLAGDVEQEHAGSTATDRAAADNAITTAVAQAATRIEASHRTARVRATIYARPLLDTTHTARITASGVDVQGKVVAITDRWNMLTGACRQEIELAVSGHNAVGLQPYTPPDPPPAPADPTPAPAAGAYACKAGTYIGQMTTSEPYDQATMIGFTTNAKLSPYYDPTSENSYPLAFSIEAPEVEAAARDPLELASTAYYDAPVAQDLFEVSKP